MGVTEPDAGQADLAVDLAGLAGGGGQGAQAQDEGGGEKVRAMQRFHQDSSRSGMGARPGWGRAGAIQAHPIGRCTCRFSAKLRVLASGPVQSREGVRAVTDGEGSQAPAVFSSAPDRTG